MEINKNSTKEEVLKAVKEKGWALFYAFDGLRNDKEVVLAAVKQWGKALKFASQELQNDEEFLKLINLNN